MADPNPNEEGDAVTFHLNGDIIAHHSRGDVEIDHVRTSLALARQQDTGLSARKAILEVSELSIIKAPDFRQPGKPLDLGKYRNYMPAVWGHCSDGAVDPVPNYDAQYRKKRKATNDQGQDEIGSAEPGDRAIRKRRREIREETQTLMTDMADMAVRLDQLRREDLNLEGQLDAERE
ncbi:hypothetical protein HDK77DRAFT_429416 [Phyllosticta capitalensis]